MNDLLAPGGALAATIPDYEDRPEQRAMATAVAAALANGHPLLVEAGTGTGKTLAYLVPAVLSGLRVVISTGTRTLQEQIARNDIPLLEELLPVPFTAVTLKGVSNYVCRRRLAAVGPELPLGADPVFDRIVDWVRDSPSGDRAEITDISDSAPIWDKITTGPEGRLGGKCPYFERCFVTRARRAADKANLILVNHHLFFADLSLRASVPGARVLPDYDAVIFDEAHQLEDVITEHYGVRVSSVRVAQLLRDFDRVVSGGAQLFMSSESRSFAASVDKAGTAFFTSVRAGMEDLGGARGERRELPADLISTGSRQQSWFDLDTALDDLRAHAEGTAARAEDDELSESLRAIARRASGMRDDLALLAERDTADASNYVYWGEAHSGGVFMHASPIEVAGILRRELLDDVPATVLTSATLTTENSFEFVRSRLGLPAELADEERHDSPFDYSRQAMLYIARDLPEPRAHDFGPAACQRIAELVAITEGRTFALFTSVRALREAAALLPKLVDYPLLVQGTTPRAALVDAFRTTPGAVLLATRGFWEGVDVPGDCLSQVIIDKLPFAAPSDPLIAARTKRIDERGEDPFSTYQLPQAALALKQGFGRLIRRRDDRGIVAVLDRRIVTKRYGAAFTNTLPRELPRTASLERVRRWWDKGRNAARLDTCQEA